MSDSKQHWYEVAVQELWKELEEKRQFGLKKYGDKSYQNSLENLGDCDLFQHAEEEMIDSINYNLANIIKLRMIKKELERRNVL